MSVCSSIPTKNNPKYLEDIILGLLHKMALVKQEDSKESFESDIWLSYWSNQDQSVKEEEVEQRVSNIKIERKDNDDSEMLLPKRGTEQTKKKRKSKPKDLTESLENATVSKSVASLCQFQCPMCGVVYRASTSLSRHFKNSKCSPGSKVYVYNCLNTIVAHQCGICTQKVLCDKAVIQGHLKSRHKLSSLVQYSNVTNVKYMDKKVDRKKEFDQFCATYLGKKELSKNIGYLCCFSCSKCGFSSGKWNRMVKHLNATKKQVHIWTPTNFVSKVTTYKCKICNDLMLCDNDILSCHLQKHKLTMTAYKEKVEPFSSVQKQKVKYLHQVKSLVKNIPCVEPMPKAILDAHTLPDYQLTKHIGNITFFKCLICPNSDNFSYSGYEQHCRRTHQFKNVQFNVRNIIEARYHKCHICSKNVLCDNAFLRAHLRKSHKISTGNYFTNFVAKNGGRAVPTISDYLKNTSVLDSLSLEDEKTSYQPRSEHDLILPSMISSESEDSD